MSCILPIINSGIVNLTTFWQTGVMKTKTPSYQRHRFSSEISSHAVWLYHRFCLSFREVEELLACYCQRKPDSQLIEHMERTASSLNTHRILSK